MDADFRYDLFFWRHAERVIEAAREFKANLVHITGPNDTGQLGVYVAHRLRLPLVISWHTNVHEYAARRVSKLMAPLLVHPNPRKPFGIAPLEAMAAGLPLVAPNAGGVLSYADETNAWLAEPNGESFAAATRAVFNDPATRKDRLARARWTANISGGS